MRKIVVAGTGVATLSDATSSDYRHQHDCYVEHQVKTCRKCGGSSFYSGGACKTCAKERAIKWHREHREIAAVLRARWRLENSEKRRAQDVKYRATHKEEIKERRKKWPSLTKSTRFLEARRIRDHNKRERKRATGGTLSAGLSKKLIKLQRGKCVCCGLLLGDDYHLDHIMPLALGGKNEDWNIQLLRGGCNLLKSVKHPIDFMQSRGFLL